MEVEFDVFFSAYKETRLKVVVVGTGFVGLVTGACFAKLGREVICVDNDNVRINGLKNRIMPFFEPGLEGLVSDQLKSGRLSFSESIHDSVSGADFVLVSVGTPTAKSGEPDVSQVFSVVENLASIIDLETKIVVKSTVPVGTCDELSQLVLKTFDKRQIDHPGECVVVSNPEFLREGEAIGDFLRPDRIVIGLQKECEKTRQQVLELYSPLIELERPILFMSARSAEMTKYAANCFLATKISFINEMARLSEILGADVEMVRTGLGADRRIGHGHLRPGIGYGGSCFPKDVQALLWQAEGVGISAPILKGTKRINDSQAEYFLDKVRIKLGGFENKTIGIWGLSFKPETDDFRAAPSVAIIKQLLLEGANVRAYDPVVKYSDYLSVCEFERSIDLLDSMYAATEGADALLVLTEWPIFGGADFEKVTYLLRGNSIFDGRNYLDRSAFKKSSLEIHSVGRREYISAPS